MPSSVISFIDYEPVTKSLVIKFVSGMVYSYKNVPVDVYENLKTAASKGVYFNKQIKGSYKFEKIKKKNSSANQPKYKEKK